jgi:L-threonylcarbamoyladenylate synthase
MSNSPFLSNCAAAMIREAAVALKAGHLVTFPTETVYGLGADARNPEAVKRIYEVKGRPTDHPLIVHISSINQLEKWAIEIPDYANSLAKAFWPGPLTLILRRSEIAGDFITGGQDTVGIRVPNDPIALALIQEFENISDSAIAAPSANRFGQVSPTSARAVLTELGCYLKPEDQMLDGGDCTVGLESTIVACVGEHPRVMRPGAITHEMIMAASGMHTAFSSDETMSVEIRVSGSLAKHYSPMATVVLDQTPNSGEGFIALASVPTPKGVIRLASPSDNEEFARILYSSLRSADERGLSRVIVHQPTGDGISSAIRDRLRRSAQGR